MFWHFLNICYYEYSPLEMILRPQQYLAVAVRKRRGGNLTPEARTLNI